ncbi:hypothetical protein VNO77_00861 [Canavalia gladiata]|uniref:Uncharacterized protein n=1 Tax=Canavalia gladiata TaxID=3824 RepID=A0AAN9MQ71_CANGL
MEMVKCFVDEVLYYDLVILQCGARPRSATEDTFPDHNLNPFPTRPLTSMRPVALMIHDNSLDCTALVPVMHHSNFCPINFRWRSVIIQRTVARRSIVQINGSENSSVEGRVSGRKRPHVVWRPVRPGGPS